MTRTYAMKRLLEHGALNATELFEITGWTRKQVWTTIDQLRKTGIVRKYKELKWGLVDLNPYPDYVINQALRLTGDLDE